MTVDRRSPAFDEAMQMPLLADCLAQSLASDNKMAALALAAPAVVAAVGADTIRVATDRAGQGYLYLHLGDGFAAVSTSAHALARLCKLPLRSAAAAAMALIGTMAGNDSWWDGVALLPQGHAVRLTGGRIVLVPFASLPIASESPLRAIVTGLSDQFPDAEIDLSGGWDTRLILSALPADRRARHHGLTLGKPGSPDVTIATALAERFGMQHRVIDPAVFLDTDPGTFMAALAEIAAADDFSLNALDRVVYHLMNRATGYSMRFNGQNGEVIRGFYYGQQPVEAPASRSLAERLVAWRIISNDRVDASLFQSDWYQDEAASLRRRLADDIMAMPGAKWGQKLDEYYQRQRMRRWAGQAATSAMASRRMLSPFFSAAFIDWAMALPVADKSGARMPARLIEAYEPTLMQVPLDTGLSPAMMLGNGLAARLARGAMTAGKVRKKVIQQLAGKSGSTLASESSMGYFARHRLHEQIDIGAIAKLGIADPARLEAFARGTWQPDQATLGMILALSGVAQMSAAIVDQG